MERKKGKYDFLIVGSGLFGAVFAHKVTAAGKSCLVVDKRSHVGGNVFCRNIQGIQVHNYGAHIFHTSDKEVWDFVNQFVPFNRYTNSPLAKYGEELYNLPFNMNTFHQLWGITTPEELSAFTGGGYRFDSESSTLRRPVFVRSFADRPVPGEWPRGR